MLQVHAFTFNAFQENTYIISDDETNECIIIDPGNSNPKEDEELLGFIKNHNLTPNRLLNTHCHIDHVLGNQLIHDQFELELEAHHLEKSVLASGVQVSQMYGIPFRGSPEIKVFLEEGGKVQLGIHEFEILLTPGHSPGSLCFYNAEHKILIGGDVLFLGSIGRTDLPGGNYDTLMGSISMKLLPLPDDVIVYSGHGPKTSIGYERENNPFLATFK